MGSKDPNEKLNDFLFWAAGRTQYERSSRFNELVTTDDDFRRLVERLGFLSDGPWQDLPRQQSSAESYEDTTDDE